MTPEEELIKLCDAADRLDTGFVGRLNARGFMATPKGIARARRHAKLLAATKLAHGHALEMEECWQIGCNDDRNHGAERSNRNVEVRVATYEALATGGTK